ncbi:synaptosomal-associated protein 47 isoform X1 [Camarhynchus parvulus]|uniref:synaptosomal-associated protein 47 isoform X1 n=1 Tax=Geospiza parvula TaxID=87175 RepID=UPI00123823B1|nr:synaptosomal-associated protein 47 isoform X1 [Camarhynchus parvulus]
MNEDIRIHSWPCSYYLDTSKQWIPGKLSLTPTSIRFTADKTGELLVDFHLSGISEIKKESSHLIFSSLTVLEKGTKHWFSSLHPNRNVVFNILEHFWREQLVSSQEAGAGAASESSKGRELTGMLEGSQKRLEDTAKAVDRAGIPLLVALQHQTLENACGSEAQGNPRGSGCQKPGGNPAANPRDHHAQDRFQRQTRQTHGASLGPGDPGLQFPAPAPLRGARRGRHLGAHSLRDQRAAEVHRQTRHLLPAPGRAHARGHPHPRDAVQQENPVLGGCSWICRSQEVPSGGSGDIHLAGSHGIAGSRDESRIAGGKRRRAGQGAGAAAESIPGGSQGAPTDPEEAQGPGPGDRSGAGAAGRGPGFHRQLRGSRHAHHRAAEPQDEEADVASRPEREGGGAGMFGTGFSRDTLGGVWDEVWKMALLGVSS